MRQIARAFLALVFCAGLAAPALAGIADSPLPVLLPGARTLHLYSVPGIRTQENLVTYFSCTSTDSVPIQVGVEVFAGPGGEPVNDATATSLSIAPGATRTFGTTSSAGITIDSNLAAGLAGTGSARILATSKKLICTAFIADNFNQPPVTTWHLTIVAKTKQKAAN